MQCRLVIAVHFLQNIRMDPNRPVAQIPQCISPVSHNTPFCNRNVHISFTKWCIVVMDICLVTGALWDLRERFIACTSQQDIGWVSCSKSDLCSMIYVIPDHYCYKCRYMIFSLIGPFEFLLSLFIKPNINGLVQDYSNSIANALELLQSCTKPVIYHSIIKNNNTC